eukprot:TRINITY_DN110834_c0_g1_i1.p1 TRINITY_DN110834_c0_g1~~TRINITY_DN110834_c0_g1_i1.p1  ORF type:complete len:599 (+),score=137.37 TRINITY_DN110834_c0_g1_i1:126-1922(+)
MANGCEDASSNSGGKRPYMVATTNVHDGGFAEAHLDNDAAPVSVAVLSIDTKSKPEQAKVQRLDTGEVLHLDVLDSSEVAKLQGDAIDEETAKMLDPALSSVEQDFEDSFDIVRPKGRTSNPGSPAPATEKAEDTQGAADAASPEKTSEATSPQPDVAEAKAEKRPEGPKLPPRTASFDISDAGLGANVKEASWPETTPCEPIEECLEEDTVFDSLGLPTAIENIDHLVTRITSFDVSTLFPVVKTERTAVGSEQKAREAAQAVNGGYAEKSAKQPWEQLNALPTMDSLVTTMTSLNVKDLFNAAETTLATIEFADPLSIKKPSESLKIIPGEKIDSKKKLGKWDNFAATTGFQDDADPVNGFVSRISGFDVSNWLGSDKAESSKKASSWSPLDDVSNAVTAFVSAATGGPTFDRAAAPPSMEFERGGKAQPKLFRTKAIMPLELSFRLPESIPPEQEMVWIAGPHGPMSVTVPPGTRHGDVVQVRIGPKALHRLVVPEGVAEGEAMVAVMPSGEHINATVPAGKKAGDEFHVCPAALMVQVPVGASAGDHLVFNAPDGLERRAHVPEGVPAGQYFDVPLQTLARDDRPAHDDRVFVE